MKTILVIFTFIFLNGISGGFVYGQNYVFTENIINPKHFSSQQYLDTANYYFAQNDFEAALIHYNLLINTTPKNADVECQKRVVEALNRSAVIHFFMNDYRTAYELLIRGLGLSEDINYTSFQPRLYLNIGNIYNRFQKYDIAKSYYEKALNLCQDSVLIIGILNNIGAVEFKLERSDNAFRIFNQASDISTRYGDAYLHDIQTNLSLYYEKRKQYDLALHYSHLALENSKKTNRIDLEALALSNIALFFFKINEIDSALHYIDLSNAIASENNFLGTLSENYLTLSNIAEAKGNTKSAFEYFRKHSALRDSILSTERFGD
ncbi:MAG: tetratricopeptide repeat protein, partial [Bacteroidales bacterium]|nr:tetratricopeptide repeat protein [Bacteroidales bacterium]